MLRVMDASVLTLSTTGPPSSAALSMRALNWKQASAVLLVSVTPTAPTMERAARMVIGVSAFLPTSGRRSVVPLGTLLSTPIPHRRPALMCPLPCPLLCLSLLLVSRVIAHSATPKELVLLRAMGVSVITRLTTGPRNSVAPSTRVPNWKQASAALLVSITPTAPTWVLAMRMVSRASVPLATSGRLSVVPLGTPLLTPTRRLPAVQ